MGTEHLLEIYVHSLSMERFTSQQMKLCDPADEKRLVTLVRLASPKPWELGKPSDDEPPPSVA